VDDFDTNSPTAGRILFRDIFSACSLSIGIFQDGFYTRRHAERRSKHRRANTPIFRVNTLFQPARAAARAFPRGATKSNTQKQRFKAIF
jgi:hypothetical protein